MSRQIHRVLILGLNFPPEHTGISPYTGALARGIARRGHATRVISAHPHYPDWHVRPGYGEWSRDETFEGVALRRLSHYVPRRPSGIRRALSEITFGLRLATQRWDKPDVIMAVSPALISTAIAQLRALLTSRNTPFVVWVQDLYSLGLSETGQSGGLVLRMMQAIEGWVLRRASCVVVIHERFAQRVHDDFGVPRSRIEVIRNWTHLPQTAATGRTAARKLLGWHEHHAIVLHAGNMGVKQGLENVVEAARLAEIGEHAVRFVFLGGGSERPRLEALAAGIGTITFLPTLPEDQFTAALHAADILLVNEKPGVAEMAVPSKLTSYFAAGRPVVAATGETGITADEIARSQAGLVVPAGDPQALLDGVLALIADAKRAEMLGSNGRRFRTTVLDEGTAIDAFDALVSRLADGESQLPPVHPDFTRSSS